MKILVYIEQIAGQTAGITGELLTLARGLAERTGGHVEALIASDAPESIGGSLAGADLVLTAADPAFAQYNPQAQAALIEAVIAARAPDLVLFGYTTMGMDLAPWLAARTGRPLAGYCIGLEPDGAGLKARSQIYGGKLIADVELPLPAIVVMAPGAVREAEGRGDEPAREAVAVPPGLAGGAVRFVSAQAPDANAIDITQVEKLVCVGRGIGEQDAIEEARGLASALGAELVSSRPLVDLGWMPKERQVGKSGRTVKPRLYLTLGVSGAPEHLEGMSAADLIIAVNTDANAPIFQVAHYRAVVDCADLIPEIVDELERQGLSHA
ncbi:electron transfer flavoprotein subunit alpha/FixB family protein [Pseudogemmobacter humi]|uniref:Acryloyl-CoA reductase electron transfer subunit beta n=1 Tax=Pseudogemmobacter humi TaxID=2483812 RepID=A0A3P5WMA3_9RHOB|nr:electron transfer flavoprotein subunit alpha/FixB family protein [Pseudogemmobacter humi]VDC22685.1 Acryloyl-CoA reductase electron transfer subunit beta [Pseudogemmobacter humi]